MYISIFNVNSTKYIGPVIDAKLTSKDRHATYIDV